jgi:hypothetical protein
VNAKAIKQTDKALLVRLGSGREFWVPQSVITDDSEVYREGDEGELIVESWWFKANVHAIRVVTDQQNVVGPSLAERMRRRAIRESRRQG